MLVLSRKRGEKVIIGGNLVVVTLVEIRGDKVRLGFEAPAHLTVHRAEVQQAIDQGETRTSTQKGKKP